jgi:hypothetical protein
VNPPVPLKFIAFLLLAALQGCEMFEHVTCAPKQMVEACLNESYQASDVGLGRSCQSLAAWAKAQKYAVNWLPDQPVHAPPWPPPRPAEGGPNSD